MNLISFLAVLIHFSTHFYGHCTTNNIQLGTQTILALPEFYVAGFAGSHAFVIQSTQPVPNFRAGITVEATEDKYLCSFDVFLGNYKVWSSSHLSQFFTSEKCVLHLTQDGDLILTGRDDEVGWRTATDHQGIKKLELSTNGNLVLVDEFDRIKWQSFHFPTNVMLWGQRLDVGTKLTSLPTNPGSFYSFEIQRERLVLYLNSGKFKYSYWQFNPTTSQNISFIRLALDGLQLFNDDSHKIAQIPTKRLQLLRFLAIDNTTGNLGLYYYSTTTSKFESSFLAPRRKCDQPSFCKSNGICTLSNECSSFRIKGFSHDFCGNFKVDMKEIKDATSVLRDENKKMVNITKGECGGLCIDDCTCVGAMFASGNRECYLYGEIKGVKEVDDYQEGSFMVKVLKGGEKGNELKKWALILIVVGDGLVLFVCLGGMLFYIFWRRKRQTNNNINN